MLLKNKTIFITGATAGFGLACATLFVKNGAKVIATGRRGDRLAKLKSKNIHTIVLDVRDRKAVDKAIKTLPKDFSKVDILINNAGLALGMSAFDKILPEDIAQMVETNILGVTHCTQALLPGMIARNRGHIVNLSSVAGTYPYPGGNVYGATKAFVTQFSLCLRADLLGKNIRVSNIEPGMCETEFSTVRFAGDKKKAANIYAGMTPLSADDIANTILWCITQPEHVNINRLEIMPTDQAFSAFAVNRKN
jgi:3-hydroxy acid dehydrogenase/malonic semialdehyde reductase